MAEPREARLRDVRVAYEIARLRRALVGASPAIVLGALALAQGADTTRVGLALVLFVASAVALVIGGTLGRGVGPGLLFGLIPFATASVAQGFGHLCLEGVCLAYCAPACAAAGVVAGALVTWTTVRARVGLLGFSSAATLIVIAGALGCRCLGTGSVAGLAAGLCAVALPALPRLVRETRVRV